MISPTILGSLLGFRPESTTQIMFQLQLRETYFTLESRDMELLEKTLLLAN